MSNFAGTKTLRLFLKCDVHRQFSWTFLLRESARDLRRIEVTVWPSTPTENILCFIEELVSNCGTLPRLLGGKELELDFAKNDFFGPFALRVIDLLEDCQREVIFRMTVRGDTELILDESDYAVDVDSSTTRYSSTKSGVVMEVEGSSTAAQDEATAQRE